MLIRTVLIPLAILALATPARADHDALDEAFAKAAPQLLEKLKARKAKNVGVLKFLVQKGDSKPEDAVGELNMDLADRLEAALILANENEKFGILDRASLGVVANNNRLANHRTEDGRQALFGDKYKLAWGSEKVKPTAFITGLAAISKDLKTVTIKLEVFGEDGQMEAIGEPIVVPTSRRTLVEAGYSYVLTEKAAPQIFDGARGSRTNKGAVAQIKQEDDSAATSLTLALNDTSKPEGVRFTAQDALRDCPVRLTILYNGKSVPIEGDRVVEPQEKDAVTFRLENTDPKFLYAVVLKVNGKNTLFGEDMEAGQCLKWILPPGGKLDILGFQEDDKTYREFKILSAKESDESLMHYGDLAGTLRMIAYRGEQVKEDPSEIEKKDPEPHATMLAAVSRGSKGLKKGDDQPGSLSALKADLLGREKELEGMRGIIEKGDKKADTRIQRVFFKTLPTVAVADISIRYYSPKN
jgi:hypothetical protein